MFAVADGGCRRGFVQRAAENCESQGTEVKRKGAAAVEEAYVVDGEGQALCCEKTCDRRQEGQSNCTQTMAYR